MGTQLMQVGESTAVVASQSYSLTPDQVELLKTTICAGSTDDELALFVNTANRMGLDPFARQIFAVKRWDSRARREVMSIQVSIDGYRLIADRTGRYAPGPENTFTETEKGLVAATAHVMKLVAGTWHTVSATARWSEYVQTTKEGAPTSMWQRMPYTMLGKCAESLALRKAFPAELGGSYTAEEMAQADYSPAYEPVPSRVDTRTGEIIDGEQHSDPDTVRYLMGCITHAEDELTLDKLVGKVNEALRDGLVTKHGTARKSLAAAVKARRAELYAAELAAADSPFGGDDDAETLALEAQARSQSDATPAELAEG